MEWMKENATNQEYYNQFKKIWDSSKELAAESTVDVDKAWERFQKRVTRQHEPAKILKPRFSWIRVAASVILIAGLGMAAIMLLNKNTAPTEMVAQTQQN